MISRPADVSAAAGMTIDMRFADTVVGRRAGKMLDRCHRGIGYRATAPRSTAVAGYQINATIPLTVQKWKPPMSVTTNPVVNTPANSATAPNRRR